MLEHCGSDDFESSLDEVRTFAFGSAEDANLVLFWNEILHVSQYRSDTEREMKWAMLLKALILDDEIKYLVGSRATNYLDREGIEQSTAAHLLTLAFIASAVSGAGHGMNNARVLTKLVAEARRNGMNPLECDYAMMSPMLRVLHPEPINSARESYKGWKDLNAVLNAWVHLVQQLGVDLADYGALEWRGFQRARRKYECERPWDDWHGVDLHPCYDDARYLTKGDACVSDDLDYRPTLFTFSYGAAPSDWKLWEVHPGDQCAGQFWARIERVGLSPEGENVCGWEMPGGWLEDW